MPRRRIEVLAAVVGAASLGAEIAAARLLAPWFGASTIVWANTIATVLVALSAGYWVGGRLADRDPTLRGLSRIVLLAAGLMAIVPFAAGPFLRVSVGALDSVQAGAFAGSLLAVLVLIAVPVLVLGCVAPYAVRLSVHAVEEAGRVAGRLYAISTMGSLAGVFLSALLLIPLVGTRRTFLAFALALALAAVPSLSPRFALAPLAVLVLLVLPAGAVKATGGERVVWERETEYQYARVVQAPDGVRRLELNEGQAVHSVYQPGHWLTGDYWDEMLVLPFAAQRGPPRSVAILGNAAGRTTRRWDVIVVDAYRQPYIPFYLATREFFALVRRHLTPDGMVVVNVGHPEGSDRLEKVLSATMGRELRTVLRDPSEPTNVMLVGTDAPVSARRLGAAVTSLPASLRPVAAATARRLAAPLRGGRVYTDDLAPVEWLIDESILKVAAQGRR
jgi:predicted membrane-bound spermidine synthase